MLRQFYHNTMEGPVSFAWNKRSAVKNMDKPRIVVCIPVGSKLSQNIEYEKETGKVTGQSPAVRIPATVPVQWMMSQMQLIHPLNTSVVYLSQYGMYAGEARQVLTAAAMQIVAEDGYVLYWDDDTLPDQTALYTMFNHMEQDPECGLLSAVYCTREPPNEPVLYKYPTQGVEWDLTVGPDAQPEEIYSAGAGFMLVRASAIRKAIEMNPDEPVWADLKVSRERADEKIDPDDPWGRDMTWGHDIRFCRLIAHAGFKVKVDGRVECGHLDLETQVVHKLPENSLPKRRGRKYHGEQHWDRIYSEEGVNEIRIFGQLYEKILGLLRPHSKIVEVGCGPGILGQLATAQGGCEWTGFDQSQSAVDLCNARFLNAEKKFVHEMTEDDLKDCDYVIAVETIRCLEPEDTERLMQMALSLGKTVIFTNPITDQPTVVDAVAMGESGTKFVTESYAKRFGYNHEIIEGDEKRVIAVLRPKGENDAESGTDSAVHVEGLEAGGGRSEVVQDSEPAPAGATRTRRRRRKQPTAAKRGSDVKD